MKKLHPLQGLHFAHGDDLPLSPVRPGWGTWTADRSICRHAAPNRGRSTAGHCPLVQCFVDQPAGDRRVQDPRVGRSTWFWVQPVCWGVGKPQSPDRSVSFRGSCSKEDGGETATRMIDSSMGVDMAPWMIILYKTWRFCSPPMIIGPGSVPIAVAKEQ